MIVTIAENIIIKVTNASDENMYYLKHTIGMLIYSILSNYVYSLYTRIKINIMDVCEHVIYIHSNVLHKSYDVKQLVTEYCNVNSVVIIQLMI